MQEHEYDVNVVRTGYACQTIRVTARNATEAKEKALEQAPSRVFSEHDSDYNAEQAVRAD